jgi:hypothetical protein
MAPSPLVLRRPLLAGVLVSTLLVPGPARALRSAQDPQARVAQCLAAPLGPEAGPVELARELAALGTEAAQPLLLALAGGGTQLEPLDASRHEAVLLALAELPRASVLAALAPFRRPEASPDQRLAGLEVLGRIGLAEDVPTLLRLAGPQSAQADAQPAIERALAASLAALQARCPDGTTVLAANLREAHPSLLVPVIRQLGQVQSKELLELLASQLGRVPGADVLLLSEIARHAPGAPLVQARRVRPRVRELLDRSDPLVRIAACHAVVALEDLESIDVLIRTLAAHEEAVRAEALAALRTLTHQRLGRDSSTWSRWHAEELAWWSGEGQRHLNVLRLQSQRGLAPAVMGLARGVIFREEIAPSLIPLLADEDPAVVRLTASVLATLGAREAVPALAQKLSHRDPAVVATVRKSLLRIAGRDLGPEPGPWLALAR